MLAYYFKLGVRSLRRNPALTALMVITLAIGVAASISTLTILHMMGTDPIPSKSERLFSPVFDNSPPEGYKPGDKPDDDQLTYIDAMNLLKAPVGERRVVLYGIGTEIESTRKDLGVFDSMGIAASHDFFAMWEVPFRYGQAWTETEDKAGADVVVLTQALAEKMFGDTDPVGQHMRMMGHDFTVVGVLAKWRMLPRAYHLISGNGTLGADDEFYVPFATAIRHEQGHNGSMNCTKRYEPGYQGRLDSECTWLQFWFEGRNAAERGDIQAWMDNYAAEQRKLGRMKRAAPNLLFDLKEWMVHMKVVRNDSKLTAWLAFGFLLLCLVNTIGLLLAKFSVRAPEVGIRRALGASRREIFNQFLIESTVVGLAGGVIGVGLAIGALALIGMQSTGISRIAHLDWTMLMSTFALSVAAAVLAGLLPTWRACQVTPAWQLKSQ